MKKVPSIITLIFAAITAICSILSLILTDEPAVINWVIVAVLSLSAVGMWVLPNFSSCKLITILPVAALIVLSNFIQLLLTQLGDGLEIELTSAKGFETLSLMLAIAFVIAMVFVFTRGCKWAQISSVVYSSLLLASQAQVFLIFLSAADALSSDTKPFILIAFAFLFASATQLSMFAGLETADECTKNEKPSEDA